MNRNSYRFALPARLLHWNVAALLPIQISLGWAAELETSRSDRFGLIRGHYQLGVLIFGLMTFRFLWRVTHRPRRYLQADSRWKRLVAKATHWTMYVLLLTMPVSGYVIWVWMDVPMDIFGVITLPRLFTPPAADETGRALAWYLHFYSSWAIIGLASFHILAALWNHYVKNEKSVMARMV